MQSTHSDLTAPVGPAALASLKVLEFGWLIASLFAARKLADVGAEVVKIGPPGASDSLRKWLLLKEGASVWWHVQSRIKRSLALDLCTPQGQDGVRRLGAEADVQKAVLRGCGIGA